MPSLLGRDGAYPEAESERGESCVGAIGMCFPGSFALSMMLELAVLAPVLCQPALPLDRPDALDIAAGEPTIAARDAIIAFFRRSLHGVRT